MKSGWPLQNTGFRVYGKCLLKGHRPLYRPFRSAHIRQASRMFDQLREGHGMSGLPLVGEGKFPDVLGQGPIKLDVTLFLEAQGSKTEEEF